MQTIFFLFICILQHIFAANIDVEYAALLRVKRQDNLGIPGFPDGSEQPEATLNCRGKRKRRPECQGQQQGGGGGGGKKKCKGKNRNTPECQAILAENGQNNQGQNPNRRPPGCRGQNKHKPECQGVGGGNKNPNRRPPGCRGQKNRKKPECQGLGGGGGGGGKKGNKKKCKRNPQLPECQNQGGLSDAAVEQAFNQIDWLEQQSQNNGLNIPGSSTQQSRFFKIASGAEDVPFHACRTPQTNERGHCRYLQHCILDEFRQNFNIFLGYVCTIGDNYIGVCCPDSRYVDTSPPVPTFPTLPTNPNQPSTKVECGVNQLQSQQTKIVGGTVARPNEHPWAAALLRRPAGTQFCGGVLISNKLVLTAAHCVRQFKTDGIAVRLGEHNLNQASESPHVDINLQDIRMHKGYDTTTQVNDIALLILEQTVTFGKAILPVCLPQPNTDYVGQQATVVGWGTTAFGGSTSTILRKVSIPVWDNTECDTAYTDNKIFPANLCAGKRAGGKDSCQGDSGGPLMLQTPNGGKTRWTLIGVVSWGIRCADVNKPGVYARVTSFLDWIETNKQ